MRGNKKEENIEIIRVKVHGVAFNFPMQTRVLGTNPTFGEQSPEEDCSRRRDKRRGGDRRAGRREDRERDEGGKSRRSAQRPRRGGGEVRGPGGRGKKEKWIE